MSRPCELGALEARNLIGKKALSPVELVDDCIARIEAANPAVNAVVAACFERAREEARTAEAAATKGGDLGPLHGLPLGIKDLNVTEGIRTTFGSLIYKDHVPHRDERIIAALRHAGAIVLGKTNTPEFGAGANTVNKVYGPTRNPFDTARTCGGSSGGSAVALACDMMPICTGSDTGGSLRIPAAFCGVVAIRGTPGLVPSDRRVIGLTTFNVQGPMARNVPDATLMLSAMAGSDACDPLARPLEPSSFRKIEEIDLSTLRVAISEDLGFAQVDNGIRETFQKCAARMAPLFERWESRNPEMKGSTKVFWLIRGLHFLAGQLDNYRMHRDLLGPNVSNNVEAGLAMKPEDIGWAYAECTRMYRKLQAFFEDFDVLICPTVAVPPFPVEQLFCTHINGVELQNYIQWADLTAGLTLSGHPVVSIPCGYDPTGTPFGIQVVGPRWHSDRFVIGVAAAIERSLDGDPEFSRPVPNIGALSATG
ncbi:MAG: amidase [Gammaproteobacteria bacterium]|nr:amidase [Gammaproteobacteria bacterium]MDH3410903.1 amidase [Gammaproteobacteria bacterium]